MFNKPQERYISEHMFHKPQEKSEHSTLLYKPTVAFRHIIFLGASFCFVLPDHYRGRLRAPARGGRCNLCRSEAASLRIFRRAVMTSPPSTIRQALALKVARATATQDVASSGVLRVGGEAAPALAPWRPPTLRAAA